MWSVHGYTKSAMRCVAASRLAQAGLAHAAAAGRTCSGTSSALASIATPATRFSLFSPSIRSFSSKSPRTRVELHPSQEARRRPVVKRHDKQTPKPYDPFQTLTPDQAEERASTAPTDDASPRTVSATATVLSVDSSLSAVSGPTRLDSQGRHEIRTKLHPDGAVVGRGRVVANFGTRMLVQELPWVDDVMSPSSDPAPTDGTRFVCQPRGKLGKIVCGDTVLWEWSSSHADSEAFIVEVLPRVTQFQRVDKSSRSGRDQVLLASNFHHICVVCASQPATNGMLLDRYLAAATRMGVTSSIIFNKVDLTDAAARFRPEMEDFRRIGVQVFETSCTKGKQQGIEALRAHLAKVGPNGTPGITIFVGQSGSGKSSLLNALSPSLRLAVNSLSKNHQGRHTTTQTILHHLEDGGEIIDSPGFQNYVPAPIPLREVAAGFREMIEPATLSHTGMHMRARAHERAARSDACHDSPLSTPLVSHSLLPLSPPAAPPLSVSFARSSSCHYGSRCLHVSEPSCGVRLAVRGSDEDVAAAFTSLRDRESASVQSAPLDERAVMGAAYLKAIEYGGGLLPDDPDSPLSLERNKQSNGEKWRRKEWESQTRRQRHAEIDAVARDNQEIKIRVIGGDETEDHNGADGAATSATATHAAASSSVSARDTAIFRELLARGLVDSISKRRYDSYRTLVEQQNQLVKNKY